MGNREPAARPVAIVTGGSRGIGRGICQALASAGYAVAINFAGNEAAARETQTLLGPQSETLLCQADIGQTGDRDRLVCAVLERWQRIDLLVNNAAITSVGRRDLLEATEASWDAVLAVDVKGPYFLAQRVAREMIAQLPTLSQPAIINIGSLSSYTVSTNRGDYCVAKAGLSMVTKLFAVRLAEYAIRVYEVCPGVIETDMTASMKEVYSQRIRDGLTPIRRWGTPADVGKAVATLATGQIPFSTGTTVMVDGGFHLRTL